MIVLNQRKQIEALVTRLSTWLLMEASEAAVRARPLINDVNHALLDILDTPDGSLVDIDRRLDDLKQSALEAALDTRLAILQVRQTRRTRTLGELQRCVRQCGEHRDAVSGAVAELLHEWSAVLNQATTDHMALDATLDAIIGDFRALMASISVTGQPREDPWMAVIAEHAHAMLPDHYIVLHRTYGIILQLPGENHAVFVSDAAEIPEDVMAESLITWTGLFK